MPIYKDVKTKTDPKTGKERTVVTYYVSIRYKDWQGNQQRHLKRGFATKKEAKEYEADFLANVSNDCKMTFKELTLKYLENRKLKGLKPTTIDNKEFLINKHFIPFFGNMPINEITSYQIEQWQKQLLAIEPKYALTYVYNLNNMLASVFYYAQRMFGLRVNPCAQTEKIGIARNDHFDYWKPEEFHKFVTSLQDTKANRSAQIKRRVSEYTLAVAFTILFYSGLREGELLALTANDIDLVNRTITVNKTYKRIKQEDHIMDPKTKSSNRILKISQNLTDTIAAYINSLPEVTPTDRLFESINVSNLTRAIHSQAKLIGIKEIRVHDLRHSCCSMLFDLGCTPLQVKTYMGHKNIQVTLNIYAHLYPEKLDEVSEKLEAVGNWYQNGINPPEPK